VKAVVQFARREIAHADLGKKLLIRFAGDLAAPWQRRGTTTPGGRNAHILISPVKAAGQDLRGRKAPAARAAVLTVRAGMPGRTSPEAPRPQLPAGRAKMRLACRQLLNMYKPFLLGLPRIPFQHEPGSFVPVPQRSARRALANLIYGVPEPQGFIVLTGEVGTGKTTMLECPARLPQRPTDRVRLPVQFPFDGGAVLRVVRYDLTSVATASPRPRPCFSLNKHAAGESQLRPHHRADRGRGSQPGVDVLEEIRFAGKP